MINTFLMAFGIGAICGIVESWNKKVMFFIWLLSIIGLIFFSAKGEYTDYGWIKFFVGLFGFLIGFYGGKIGYEQTQF